MKARFHASLQLAWLGTLALVAGNFVCLEQPAMAQGANPPQDQTTSSTKKPADKPPPAASGPQAPVMWFRGVPLYAPPGATMGSKPLPSAATPPRPADTTPESPKTKAQKAGPAQPVGKQKGMQTTASPQSGSPGSRQSDAKSKTAKGAQGDAVKAPAETGQPPGKTSSPTLPSAAAGQPTGQAPSQASPSAAMPGNKELEGDINANLGIGGAGALPSPTGPKAPATPPGAKAPTAATTSPSKSPAMGIASTGPSSPSVDVPTTPGPGAGFTPPVIQFPPAVKTTPGPLGQPAAPMPQALQGWPPLPPDLTQVMKQMPPDLLRKAMPPGPYQETMRGIAPPVGDIYGSDGELNRFRQQEGPNATDIPGIPSPDRVPSPTAAKGIEDAVKQGVEQGFKKGAPPPVKSAYDKLQTADKVGEDVVNTDSLAPAGREVQDRVNDAVISGIADQVKDQVKDVMGQGPVANLVNKGVDKVADGAKDVAKKAEDVVIFEGQDFKPPGAAPPGPAGYEDTISPYEKK